MFNKILSLTILICVSAQKHEDFNNTHEPYHYNGPAPKPVYIEPAHVAPTLIKTPGLSAYASQPLTPIRNVANLNPHIQHEQHSDFHSHHEEYSDLHPKYSYQYGIKDQHSGDMHNQHEERDGDVVKGAYSLVQPDGITRTVLYTADKTGFNAQVEYSGHATHPQPVHKEMSTNQQAPNENAYHH